MNHSMQKQSSRGIIMAVHVVEESPLGFEVVYLASQLDAVRAEDFELSEFFEVKAYKASGDFIEEELLLNAKDGLIEVKM